MDHPTDLTIDPRLIRIVDDRSISKKPIRIIDLKVDKGKLMMKSLVLLNVGHIPGRIHYRKNARFKDWAIVYIAEGSGTYRLHGGQDQPVRKGTLFLLYPNSVFHYGPGENEYWDEYYFTIEGSRIRDWLEACWLEQGKVKQTTGDPIANISRIRMLMETGVPSNADRAALLLESLLFELLAESHTVPPAVEREEISRVIGDLANYLYEPFDALKLCEKNKISMPTLRRIVSKYTGYPLNEYIHRLKMAEAKNILLNTGLSIKEVAPSLGYADEFYFSRVFKKFVGVSPNQYRHG